MVPTFFRLEIVSRLIGYEWSICFRIKMKAILESFIHIIVNLTNYVTEKWSRQSNFRFYDQCRLILEKLKYFVRLKVQINSISVRI